MTTGTKRSSDRLTPSQARAARRARRQARKKALRIGAFTVVGVIALLFILALFLPSLPIQIGSSAPDGPGERMPSQGTDSVDPGEDHPPYNSVPATSGWHYVQPLAPARWGVHEEPLPDEVLVHNLKQGGIGIHYDCPDGCPELVAKLEAMADLADKILVAPYPGMESTIALTAWTFIEKLDGFDEGRITEFMSAHLNSPNAPGP